MVYYLVPYAFHRQSCHQSGTALHTVHSLPAAVYWARIMAVRTPRLRSAVAFFVITRIQQTEGERAVGVPRVLITDLEYC